MIQDCKTTTSLLSRIHFNIKGIIMRNELFELSCFVCKNNSQINNVMERVLGKY